MSRAALLLLPLLLGALLLRPAARRSGCVRSAGRPLPGASVRYKGTPFRAFADADGLFSLPLRPGRLTASAPGHLIAGPSLDLRPLPAEDDPAYRWVDPAPDPADDQRCANCHGAIHREWAGSAHSRSSSGARFREIYSRLLRQKPDGAGVCSSCHAPALGDDDPAVFDLRRAAGFQAGIHCDYCHKVAGLHQGEIGLSHGKHLLKLLRPGAGRQLFFGPLDDVDRGEDAHSPLFRDSRYCAACHEGTVFGTAVYTTYSEWRASPAARQGKQCQDCHMKPTGRLGNLAPGRGGIARDPLTLGNHSFWDGSQAGMLRRSLRLRGRIEQGEAVVRVTAQDAGHRVPTGWIEREVELDVQGFDVAGRLLGKGGRVYGRAASGPFWDMPDIVDTRLLPGVPDERRFAFGPGLARVRARLRHRRYPGGPEILIAERAWP